MFDGLVTQQLMSVKLMVCQIFVSDVLSLEIHHY